MLHAGAGGFMPSQVNWMQYYNGVEWLTVQIRLFVVGLLLTVAPLCLSPFMHSHSIPGKIILKQEDKQRGLLSIAHFLYQATVSGC